MAAVSILCRTIVRLNKKRFCSKQQSSASADNCRRASSDEGYSVLDKKHCVNMKEKFNYLQTGVEHVEAVWRCWCVWDKRNYQAKHSSEKRLSVRVA